MIALRVTRALKCAGQVRPLHIQSCLMFKEKREGETPAKQEEGDISKFTLDGKAQRKATEAERWMLYFHAYMRSRGQYEKKEDVPDYVR